MIIKLSPCPDCTYKIYSDNVSTRITGESGETHWEATVVLQIQDDCGTDGEARPIRKNPAGNLRVHTKLGAVPRGKGVPEPLPQQGKRPVLSGDTGGGI